MKELSKNKVLDLEIADYEKSIKSLNVQLISKDKELNDLRSDQSLLTSSLDKIKSDVEKLENDLAEEREKSQKLKQLLVIATKDLMDAKVHEAEHQSNDATSRNQIEHLQMDLDAYKVQMLEQGAEKEKLKDRVNSLMDANQRSLESYERKLNEKGEEIVGLTKRLENLQSDYEAYKLKVTFLNYSILLTNSLPKFLK